ncbi:MAG TPA: metallophosphoesterase family protein [Methyloceanibacter sp.]|nr:metallophosphoesterase family protein [Methyloceanibacter sp.]
MGDIHGRLDLLEAILELIADDAAAEANAEQRTLVFLGDYVDRGPDSRGVVERLITGSTQGFDTHFLKGNHEAILLDFLQEAWRLDHWLLNGGEATMRSYGVDTARLALLGAPPEVWRQAFAECLPGAHLRFFKSLKLNVSFGDYLFVHAGVRPGVPLAAQAEADLVWIRGPFLNHAEPFGKIVVHGHTPETMPVVRSNRIGIDTGAVFTGRLTALKLRDGARDFLQT